MAPLILTSRMARSICMYRTAGLCPKGSAETIDPRGWDDLDDPTRMVHQRTLAVQGLAAQYIASLARWVSVADQYRSVSNDPLPSRSDEFEELPVGIDSCRDDPYGMDDMHHMGQSTHLC